MKILQDFYPENSYASQLKVINGILFTPREIDVLACILSGRSAKKIASFLLISPKTAENHIRSLLLKIEVRSQEGIIDFIEKSDKFIYVKKHYSCLLIRYAFEEELKKISIFLNKKNLSCSVIYKTEKNKRSYIEQFESDLKLAGINFVIESEKTEKNKIQTIVLVMNNESIVTCPKKSQEFNHININDHENYYFLVLDTLKKIFPSSIIDNSIAEFKTKYKMLIDYSSTKAIPENKILHSEKNNNAINKIFIFALKNKMISAGLGIVVCLLLICFLFLISNPKEPRENKQESLFAHSYNHTLITPETSFLLKQIQVGKTVAWNLPRQDVQFIGRKQLLDELDKALPPPHSYFQKKGNQTKRNLTVNVCAGLGGVGKTQLALQYLLHNQHSYLLLGWFSAENLEQLKGQYIEFSKALGFRQKESSPESAISYVKEWLTEHPGWLLVYDNVGNYNEIKSFLPDYGGNIILTSRKQDWPTSFKILDIDVMKEVEAIELLQSLISRSLNDEVRKEEVSDVKELVKLLGYLPLALAQAGAYIHQSSLPIKEYLTLCKEHEQELLTDNSKPEGTNNLPVAITWKLSIEAIAKEASINKQPPLALHLLSVCAYFAPEIIPKQVLLSWLKENDPGCTNELILPKLINQLWQYSMISKLDGGNIKVHRLVQSVLRNQHKKVLENKNAHLPLITLRWYTTMLSAIHSVFWIKKNTLEDEINQKLLLPHLQSLVNNHKLLWPKQETLELSRVLYDIAHVLRFHFGNSKSSKHYYEQALAIQKRCYPTDNIEVAKTLAGLGNVYRDIGNNPEAKKLLTRALHLMEAHFGKNHPEISVVLHNLASVYRRSGFPESAKQLLERAKMLIEQHYGINYPELYIVLTKLGNVYVNLGDITKAKEILGQALTIGETHYGKDHVAVSEPLNSLGNAFTIEGNYEKAKDVLKRVLIIREGFYGKDAKRVGHSLTHLGYAFANLGDPIKGKEMLENALKIMKSNYGDHYFRVALAIRYLGSTEAMLGNVKKAKALLIEALKIEEQYYNENHYEVANTLVVLSDICIELNEIEEAKIFIDRALKIKNANYTENNPEVAKALLSLAKLHIILKEPEFAHSLATKCYNVFLKEYGENSSYTKEALALL